MNIHADDPPVAVLARGRLLALDHARAARLTVVSGRILLTEAGVSADRLLLPGQIYRVAGRGRVLLEAIDEARVRVESPVPAAAWLPRFTSFFWRRSLRWNY